MIIDVVIPAYNEVNTIARVVGDIDKSLVRFVVVADNNSTDGTAEVARAAGAVVVKETEQGYGAACLKGIEYLMVQPVQPDIVAFLDGDYSDYPEQLIQVVQPILDGKCEMVIGSRALGQREAGSMMPQQRFGNWLATTMIRVLYKARFTDLGPFRAITTPALKRIRMCDRNYGWTVEMQVKAAKEKITFQEVPVDYRQRGAGQSKVAGTVKGTILAGWKIISTILKYA
jgi:glycosyltransferase involved in cell wall biosynthesis